MGSACLEEQVVGLKAALDDTPQWQKDMAKWGGELGSALAPLRALQEELEFYGEADDEPRPEAIRGQVRAATAMMPLLKVLLHELQNWPNGPTERKPREKKEGKKK